jgi:hypothetical protein
MISMTTGVHEGAGVTEIGKVEVRVTKGADLNWLVSLGPRIVANFTLVGDALAYASMLECNPRARREAAAA